MPTTDVACDGRFRNSVLPKPTPHITPRRSRAKRSATLTKDNQ